MLDGSHQTPLRIGLLAIVALLLSCASASAAPSWLTPTPLSMPGQNGTSAQVAVDARGDSVAVWQRPDGGGNNVVQAAVRPPGGGWQTTPTNLASCFFFATNPEVAVDLAGDAIAVWMCATNVGAHIFVDAATRPAGGTWSQPVQLSDSSTATGGDAKDPQVALDSDGDATVVWLQGSGGADVFIQAAQRPAGGTWTAPVGLTATDGSVQTPQVAMDPQGDATAVWTINDGVNFVTETRIRSAGSTAWGPPQDLSAGDAEALNPQVAMSPLGTSVAVWQHGTGTGAAIQAAAHRAGGQWQTSEDISATGQLAEHPRVAFDPQGDATAVWDRSDGTNTIVQAAELPAGAPAWQDPAELSVTGESAANADVAADAQGDLLAVWQRSNATNTIVQGAAHPAGGTWEAPKSLSTAGENAENPEVAVDPRGNATTVWDRSNGTDMIGQAAGYDAGPLLDGVSIPHGGTAGTPLTFAAQPLGIWSPVASTSWSFGDGQTASGTAVSHTYAKPGTYAVTMTSTDGLGNPTSQTAQIAIVPGTSHPVAPTLTHVSQSHTEWRESKKPATIARKHRPKAPPVGTTFSFTVNQPARVTLTFTQSSAGRRVNGKCRTPSKHDRERPHCKRMVTRGTLGYSVTAGRHTVAFNGRIGGRKLPLGAYTLRLTATNPTSQQRSRTASLRFTIAK
jgi:PKD domain